MLNPPTLAERLAYGSPLDPDLDDEPIRNTPRSTTALIGRLLIAVIFLVSGFAKLANPEQTAGYMASVGIPAADSLVYVAGLAEILGGLSIALGFLTRVGALGLIIMQIPTTLLFHGFWNFSGPEQQMQMTQFMKNLAIIGGLSMLVANGAGRYSIDGKMRKPMQP